MISRASLDRLLGAVEGAVARGATRVGRRQRRRRARARLLHGADGARERVAPTTSCRSRSCSVRSPASIASSDFDEAVRLANATTFGLTGAIHTANMHRTQEFIARYRGGLVSINGATYGAGPHMPFGGVKNSGNGFREPGTEALDVYSEWKTVVVNHDPDARVTNVFGGQGNDGKRRSVFRSPAAPTTAAASC